jgi:hypothetical protein
MSKASVVLGLAWVVLALRTGLGVAHGESIRDALSLPILLLFVLTVVVGSRAWVALARPKSTSELVDQPRLPGA